MTDAATGTAALFTRSDGTFLFSRWGRPIAPVIFGMADESLPAAKGAIAAVCALAGLPMVETDPELGANLMVFAFREWDELRAVPHLDRLVEGLHPLVDRLVAADANQYRIFRFDESGAIRAAFVFLRMDAHLSAVPAADLMLVQAVQVILLWSDTAFADGAPLAMAGGQVILRPEIGAVIRAAYDPVLPAASRDPSHALRIAARIARPA
jgi:hypothetical protein